MGDSIQPDEPVIVFTVRSLIRDLRDDLTHRFEELNRKLDDRPTLGMFRAAQSEVDALRKRISDIEDANDAKRVSDRALAWAALLVGALTAIATIAWLWIGG
jgi:hypothetical protein